MRDRYDNLLTTTSATARDAYVEGVDHVLAATHGAVEAFQTAIAADPGFALGHAGLARAHMYASNIADAKLAIAEAERLAPATTSREQAHVAAFSALLSGNADKARDLTLAHALDYPRDALVMQLCTNVFGLIGFSGQPGREAALLAFTSELLPHYGEDWWAMAVHAVSLCEVGEVSASLSMMERALALKPDNAHASHFKSHGLYEAGETGAGLDYLDGWLAGYDPRALLHGHLSWHLALWLLHDGQVERMWDVVDSGVGPRGSKGLPINIVTDTAAILYRAELAGADVAPERWSEISAYAAARFPKPGQSFVDMHAALAHAMAGKGDRLAVYAEAGGFAGDLVAPVAAGWAAIARQDWTEALERMTPVMAGHARLGGSRAQRDLLELTWLNLLLKLGHSGEARRMIATRRPVLAEAVPISGFG